VPRWTVTGSDFDAASRFTCPTCGTADCRIHDTEQMTWRHLTYFRHQAHLYARMPACAASSVG
jgi:transposase